jgi:hypothetical protein
MSNSAVFCNLNKSRVFPANNYATAIYEGFPFTPYSEMTHCIFLRGDRGRAVDKYKWTKRFTRNIEIIKGAAHGAISPTPSLSLRAIGETYKEFLANLYMPEELLRNRDKYEARIYPYKLDRKPGTGDVEKFREFVLRLLSIQDKAFFEFHDAVSPCTKEAIKYALKTYKNVEVKEWLAWYRK